MKLSERVSTMHWMFGPNDDRRDAVRVLADDIKALEQYAERLEQCIEAERARVAPVAHEHSPIVLDDVGRQEVNAPPFDPAKPGDDRTVAVVMVDGQPHAVVNWVPVNERKVAEAYREKVLAALRAWGERPRDLRTPADVVMGVDLP